MESKTPQTSELLEDLEQTATIDSMIRGMIERRLGLDIAALEARHAEEIARIEQAFKAMQSELSEKIRDRDAMILKMEDSHAEELNTAIANAIKSCHEQNSKLEDQHAEAANEIESTTFGGQSREHLDGAMGAVDRICRMILREKAGKL